MLWGVIARVPWTLMFVTSFSEQINLLLFSLDKLSNNEHLRKLNPD